MNILAIGAHPDDIEIACAGTLLRYKEQGHQIFIAVSTSGNQGSTTLDRDAIARVREREASQSALILGARIRFMGYDDEGLLDTRETRRGFINCIRWANPDVILTHWPEDKSTDHGMTGRLTTQVLLSLQSPNIAADEPPISKLPAVFYFDTGCGVDFCPEFYVDVTEVIDRKKLAYACHVSQLDWMKVYGISDFGQYLDLFSGFRGLQAGTRYAEGFRALRLWSYMPDPKKLP